MKKPASRELLDFEHSIRHLKTITARVRSDRPLVHTMPGYSISDLKEWGLLQVGQTNRKDFDSGLSVTTTLAGKRHTLKIQIAKAVLIVPMESRPLKKGLVWYFRLPSTGQLVKSVYFSGGGVLSGRKASGGLYASQFQSKTHRQLLRMDKLILAIDGDRSGRVGPARGASKMKKLEHLSRIFSAVRAADREREKVLSKFPQLHFTICAANTLLKREVGDKHRSWVPSRKVVRRGHYSTNGLDIIPR
jgi:hypothetical protein